MRRVIHAGALCALTLATLSARAEFAEIQWTAGGTASHEFDVMPGKFAEWCGRLRRDDKVQWQFEAGAPLNVNVHYHQGKEVRFPARQDGVAKADGQLDVALDQDYCWMWTNKSTSPVHLTARLQKVR